MCTFPAEALQGNAPPSCFSFLLYGLLISHIFHIFVLFVGSFTGYNGPKCSAEGPSSVLTYKKAVTCLRKVIPMLAKLHSIVGYRDAGPELSVNELTIYIKKTMSLNGNTLQTHVCIDWLTKM